MNKSTFLTKWADFLKKKPKRYMGCFWMEHGLSFHNGIIRHCCCSLGENGWLPPIMRYSGEELDYKKIFKAKRAFRKQFQNGNIPSYCKNCSCLKEQEWSQEDYIEYIGFDQFIGCALDCVYCKEKKMYKSDFLKAQYKYLPLIKQLAEKNLLKTTGEFFLVGGEPTQSQEFEELLAFVLNFGVKKVNVFTNAVKFSKSIEEGIRNSRVELLISPDAGNRDLYKRIKGADCFDIVWENIKKYVQAQAESKFAVTLKYVVIPGINDTEEDIKDFFKKAQESGVKAVRLDIEINWTVENRNNIESVTSIFKLFKFAEKEVKNYNFEKYFLNAGAETLVREKQEIYDIIEA